MKTVIAASGESSPFHSITGKLLTDDHHNDYTFALTIFIPIFAKCQIINNDRADLMLECSTAPNRDKATVRARFDQMVSDITPLIKNGDAHIEDCAKWSMPAQRCFIAGVPGGLLRLSYSEGSILMDVGNQ